MIVIRRATLGLLAGLAVVGCGSGERATFPDAVDGAIYQLVVDSLYLPRALSPGGHHLVLVNATDPYPQDSSYAWVYEQFLRLPTVDSGMVQAFKRRNKESRSLAGLPALHFRGRVVLVDGNALPSAHIETPPGWFWPAFKKQFPQAGGYMSVSAIGYNEGRERAILAVDYKGLDGAGEVLNIAAQIVGGRWRIVAAEVMKPRAPAT